jgi:tetratricopeptide (TPR) repeat protein
LALGKPEGAIERVAAALKSDPPAVLRAQALLVESAAQLAKGDSTQATKTLSSGLSSKEWTRLPEAIRAEQAALRAAIATAENRAGDAKTLQDEAAALWKKAGRLPEMARTLAAAGRQAKASGDLAGACDRFYRAARSLWAQGLQPEAVRTLEEGVACAEEFKEEAVGKKMAELFVTFKEGKRLSE